MNYAIRTNIKSHFSIDKILLLAAVWVLMAVQLSFASPAGEQVVAGQASFDRQGNSLTVSNTPNTIINWQNFSIGSNEAVRFIQKNNQSAVLNRVVGQNPSTILGLLQSNGKVLLINPNGIVFGLGARVDVQGLIASTLNIGNEDFLSGRYLFKAGSKSAGIVNDGIIRTPSGGSVYLIASNVTNNGVITTPGGQVLLAAGHSVKLVDSANPEIAVVVSAPANQAVNLGSIIAESGSVGIYGALVRQAGQVNADSAVKDSQGRIVLKASQTVELAQTSVTTAVNSSGRGGVIQITGDEVSLQSGAKVDASGKTGGGEIYIGGGYQGGDASISNARQTSVERGVQLSADALTEGDGGKVVVWSDENTAFAGKISARGGNITGDGGVAEVSGKKTLTYDGLVDLSAPRGHSGTLLLDPLNLTIGTDITGAALSNQLALSNVIVQTSDSGSDAGNIYVNDSVSWANGNTLTMKAHNDIVINNTITNSGGGALRLRSDSDGSGVGTVLFGAGGQVIFTAGGQASIYYNPAGGYTSPTSYAAYFSGVTPTAYMLVNNVNQLQAMNTNLGGTYALGKDIDASATSGWNSGAGFLPIGYYDPSNPLAGPSEPLYITFDGNGYTISNLFINRPTMQYVGLFRGSTDGNPTFRNIWLFNVNITGGFQTGGAVAHLGVGHALAYSFVTGTVTGGSNVGGLVGLSAGPISNCYSKATVTGGTWVGGLVGTNWGTQARITNSYSTGLVSGSSSVGGLVGYAYNTVASPVTASYWNTQTSGRATSAGGTGKTTAEMMSEATFSGWDFTNIWGINEGSSYPYFTGNHLNPSGTTVVVDPVTPTPTPVPSTPNPIIARQMAADNTAVARQTVLNNFYLSWDENVPHYDSWDDYFKTHVRAIAWNENVKHYDSMEDYIQDQHPTAMAMNRSLQLDAEGRFIDGLLNPLDYLTLAGGGSLGFADLQDGGIYGGYNQSWAGEYQGYTSSKFQMESTITRTKADQDLADKINAGKKVPLNFVHDSDSSSGQKTDTTLTAEQWEFIKKVNSLRGSSDTTYNTEGQGGATIQSSTGTGAGSSGSSKTSMLSQLSPAEIVRLAEKGEIDLRTLTEKQLLSVMDDNNAFDSLINSKNANANVAALYDAGRAARDRRAADKYSPAQIVELVNAGVINPRNLTQQQLLRVMDDDAAFESILNAKSSSANAAALYNAGDVARDRRAADKYSPAQIVELVDAGVINPRNLTQQQLLRVMDDDAAFESILNAKSTSANAAALYNAGDVARDRRAADKFTPAQVVELVDAGVIDTKNLTQAQLQMVEKERLAPSVSGSAFVPKVTSVSNDTSPAEIVRLARNGALDPGALTQQQLLQVMDDDAAFESILNAKSSNANVAALYNAGDVARDRRSADKSSPVQVVELVDAGVIKPQNLTQQQILNVMDDDAAFESILNAKASNSNVAALYNAGDVARDRRSADKSSPVQVVELVDAGVINPQNLTQQQILKVMDDDAAFESILNAKSSSSNVAALFNAGDVARDRRAADSYSPEKIVELVDAGVLNPQNLTQQQLLKVMDDSDAFASLLDAKSSSSNVATLYNAGDVARDRRAADKCTPVQLVELVDAKVIDSRNLTDQQRQTLELERNRQIAGTPGLTGK